MTTRGGLLTPGINPDALVNASDPLAAELVAPPKDGADICPLCHSWRPPAQVICDSCEVTGRAVGFPLASPSVITLTTKPSPLRGWLTRYKGRPSDADDPFDSKSYERIRAMIGRFLIEHGNRLADLVGPLDALVVVPSGGARPLPHPLERILTELLLPVPVDTLLARGPGALNFRLSAVDGFVPTRRATPRRVLLVDDVFVTGARIFSAARALRDNFHTVAGALVIARRVNREWGDCQAMWDRQVARGFSWATGPLVLGAQEELLHRIRDADGM